jgi:hypothetical protein
LVFSIAWLVFLIFLEKPTLLFDAYRRFNSGNFKKLIASGVLTYNFILFKRKILKFVDNFNRLNGFYLFLVFVAWLSFQISLNTVFKFIAC